MKQENERAALPLPQTTLLVSKQRRNQASVHRYQCDRLLDKVLETFASRRPEETSQSKRIRVVSSYSNNSRMTKSPSALSLYFRDLALERGNLVCDRINIVVDNARIPLQRQPAETATMDDDDEESRTLFYERMSRSLSDVAAVPFPPPFLLKDENLSAACTSRWDAFNGSSSSIDVTLEMPHRTKDSIEENSRVRFLVDFSVPVHLSRRTYLGCCPPSLDSTETQLQELPWDSGSAHSLNDDAASSSSSTLDGRASLKDTTLSEGEGAAQKADGNTELSPRSINPYTIPGGVSNAALGNCSKGFSEGISSTYNQIDSAKEPEDIRGTPPLPPKALLLDRWSPPSPNVRVSGRMHMGKADQPISKTHDSELKLLPHQHLSPRSFADFPLAPSVVSPWMESNLFKGEGLGKIFESTGRILGIGPDEIEQPASSHP